MCGIGPEYLKRKKSESLLSMITSQLPSALSLKAYKPLSTAHKEQGVEKTLMKAEVIKKHLDISDKIKHN